MYIVFRKEEKMLKLKKQYAGSYKIIGHNRDYPIYIDRSDFDPKLWCCDGRWFSSLADAKACMFADLDA